MTSLLESIGAHINYYGYVVVALIGFFAMMTQANLMRQVIGLTVFQTGIMLFFISSATKWRATLPIVPPEGTVEAAAYMNPLPHALMLTAIVVAVATLGVALAILIRIKGDCGTLDEDEILEQSR